MESIRQRLWHNCHSWKEDVMQAAQNSFISSTFGLKGLDHLCFKTLEVMERKTWNQISKIGKGIKLKWNDLV